MTVTEHLLSGDHSSPGFFRAVEASQACDVAAVLALATHDDREIRIAVAVTLPLLMPGLAPTDAVIGAVVGLSTDPDPRVRDVACFALAELWREVDTDIVREALAARLDDADLDTRCEALAGLAYRRDGRALPHVRAALSRPGGDVTRLGLVAAGALSDPQLHDLVLQHQTGWDDPSAARTADLARRLTDPAGPGDDVLDGVAELSRRRAHGWPDGDALSAWHVMADLLDIAPYRAEDFLAAVCARLAGDDAALHEVRTRSALAQLAATGW